MKIKYMILYREQTELIIIEADNMQQAFEIAYEKYGLSSAISIEEIE